MQNISKGALVTLKRALNGQPSGLEGVVIYSDQEGIIVLFSNGFTTDFDFETASEALDQAGHDQKANVRPFELSNIINEAQEFYNQGGMSHRWGNPHSIDWKNKQEDDGAKDMAESTEEDLKELIKKPNPDELGNNS